MWEVRAMAVRQTRASNERELRRLFDGRPMQGVFAVGFGADGRMCGVAVNRRHQSLSFLKVWELAEMVAELGASTLRIAVFPAGRGSEPTAHECAVFADLMARARRAAVPLVDCYLFRGDRMWSLRETVNPEWSGRTWRPGQ
jgi:hypothetical protein